MSIFRRFVVLAAVIICALPVRADERILSYDSLIRIHEDSTMTVSETIRVRAEGINIQHGIYRDFPTVYRGKRGINHITAFTVVEVTRDGKDEDFFFKRMKNGKRLYIGQKEYFLPHGDYTYTITYKTDRQVGFLDDHDELYWNVTGNSWMFPIDTASARLVLPQSTVVKKQKGYTGMQGSQGSDLTMTADINGNSVFRTTRPLKQYEGLTIVAAWQKGIIHEPTRMMTIRYFLRDTRVLLLSVGVFSMLLLYYLIAWNRVGKDPEKGVIMPRFTPPDKLSPASMRYVRKMGFDNTVFAAAVLNLAVKGCITIEQKKKGEYTLNKLRIPEGDEVSKGEQRVFMKVFEGRESLTLTNKNHTAINAAVKTLHKFLRTEYRISHFRTNSTYIIPGIAISILGLFMVLANLEIEPAAVMLTVHFFIWPPVFILFSRMIIPKWKKFFRTWSPSHLCGALFFTPHFFMLIIAIIVMPVILFRMNWTLMIFLVLLLCSNIIFYYLLRAPTALGRKAMDAIEGFKIYLSTTEKDRLNLLNPPEKTPQLFEKYLPYALALDVEQEWAEQFEDVLRRAAMESGKSGSSMHTWYHGESSRFSSSFASSLAGSLSSAISSSSRPPGSGNGFSGGGGAGGGGGGGGGGGW